METFDEMVNKDRVTLTAPIKTVEVRKKLIKIKYDAMGDIR